MLSEKKGYSLIPNGETECFPLEDIETEIESSESSEEVDVIETQENLKYENKIAVGRLSRIGSKRSLWTTKFSSYLVMFPFLMNCQSLVIFPLMYSMMGNGFPFAYWTCMIFIGLPLIYMELALGQYTSLNAITLFERMAPAFSGLGFAMMIYDFLNFLNDQLLMLFIGYMLFYSANFTLNQMPWHNCVTAENTPGCHSYQQSCGENNRMVWAKRDEKSEHLLTHYDVQPSSLGDSCVLSGVSVFQSYQRVYDFTSWFSSEAITQQLFPSTDMRSFSSIGWPTLHFVTGLVVSWFLVAILSQVKRGKMVMLSMAAIMFLFSFIALCGLVLFLYVPPFPNLQSIDLELNFNLDVWLFAMIHVVLACKIGTGRLIFIGVQNSFRNNILRDAIVIFLFMSVVPFIYSFFFNITMNSELLGQLQGDTRAWDSYVRQAYESRIFSDFLDHIVVTLFLDSIQMYDSYEPFIVFLFTSLVILFLLAGKVVQMEYYVASLTEKFEMASEPEARRTVAYILCTIGCLSMLPFFSETGLEIIIALHAIVFTVAGVGIFLLEIVVVCYCYHGKRVLANITAMSSNDEQTYDFRCGCMASLIKDLVSQNGWLGNYEELLFGLYEWSKYGTSKAEMERRFSFARNMTGSSSCISFQQIDKLRQQVCNELVAETVYKCPECKSLKENEMDRCTNCPSVLPKRSTMGQSHILKRFNIGHQLFRIISWHGRTIIDERRDFHAGNSRFAEDDMRGKLGHTSRIETRQQFTTSNLVVLPAMCHIDGTRFDKKSKGSDWPLSIALCDLAPMDRCKVSNLIFGGCYSAYKKPSSSEWGELMKLCERELKLLEIVGLRMDFGGETYTFRLKVSFPVVDLEALSMAYDFTAAGYYGCPSCYIRGVYSHGAVRFPAHAVGARTDDDNRWDSLLRQYGWRGDRNMLLLVELEYIVDFLHVCEEGFFRDLLTDICGKTQKTPELGLDPNILLLANQIASNCKLPTNIAGRLRPLTDCCSQVNCKERRLAFFVQLLPILAASPSDYPELDGLVILLLINHRRLFERKTSEADLDAIGAVVEKLGRLFNLLLGLRSATLKSHLYLTHIRRQLKELGNIVDVDTTPFENLLGRLKREGSCHATQNYLNGSFERLFLLSISMDEIVELGGSAEMSALNDAYDDLFEVRGARGGSWMNDDILIPMRCELTNEEERRDPNYVRLRRLYPAIQAIRRFSYLKQSLSVRKHWTRAKLTEQSMIMVEYGGTVHYGEIVAVGIHNNDSLRMIVSCYQTACAFSATITKLRGAGTANSRDLLLLFDEIVVNNVFIREVNPNQPRYELICSDKDITGIFSNVEFDARSYVVSIPMRGIYV